MEKKGHFPSYIYRGYKSDIYEGGHRIPLIVSWKGKYGKETNNSLVSLIDFYATFAQMLNHNLETEEAVDSYSMWPILSKKGASARKDLVHEAGEGYLFFAYFPTEIGILRRFGWLFLSSQTF